MDQGQAWIRFKAMVAADTAPVLDAAELELLLEMHRVADANGIAPGATDWIPGWDLKLAALEGWRWKAAKATASFDFQADGATYNRSQTLEMCEKMIAQYRRRVVSSLPLTERQPEVTEEA